MGFGDQPVEVLQSRFILYKNYLVIGGQLFIVAASHLFLQLVNVMDIQTLGQQPAQVQKDVGQHLRIINSAMMVELSEVEILGKRIELDVIDIRQNRARDRNGIDRCEVILHAHVFARFADKTGIKRRIVRDHNGAVAEFQKLLYRLALRRRAGNHAVGDTGQLDDLSRDRTLRVDKGRELIDDHTVLDLDRADLGNLIMIGVQTRGFQVEAHEFTVERLVFIAVYGCA